MGRRAIRLAAPLLLRQPEPSEQAIVEGKRGGIRFTVRLDLLIVLAMWRSAVRTLRHLAHFGGERVNRVLRERMSSVGKVAINCATATVAGPPLLLLHGVTNRWQTWLPIMPSLSLRWQVHALDSRTRRFRSHTGGISD